jgi:hypothetical protein
MKYHLFKINMKLLNLSLLLSWTFSKKDSRNINDDFGIDLNISAIQLEGFVKIRYIYTIIW